jgi:hypothetical protein
MSAHHGDTTPLVSVPIAKEARLLRFILLAGTVAFLVLAVGTFRAPGAPLLGEMQETTASSPRVSERCDITHGGGVAPSTTCTWELWLDGGTRLAWPWASPGGSLLQTTAILRDNAPVTVRFWRDTVYQIELNDGRVFLQYVDTAGGEWFRQWVIVLIGVFVGGLSLVRIELELRRLRDPITEPRGEDLANALNGASLLGALVLAAGGIERMWAGVVGLALFSAAVPALGMAFRRRRLGLKRHLPLPPA